MMIRLSGVICGVTSSRSTGFLERDRRRVVRAAGRHVRNLGALLDLRLLVVAGHDARARDDLAAVVRLERRELEVDEVAAAEVDQRQRELARRAR